MADKLKRPLGEPNGDGPSRRALRVAFAPNTRLERPERQEQRRERGPEQGPEGETDRTGGGAAVIETGPAGHVIVDGRRLAARLTDVQPPRAKLVIEAGEQGSSIHDVLLASLRDPVRSAAGVRRLEVVVDGWRFELDVDSDLRARLRERATSARSDAAKGGPSELRAIIPGRVVSVDVAEGDTVEPGGRLLVIEAMKMQNELKAPRAGTIARVAVGAGQTVELGDLLLVIA